LKHPIGTTSGIVRRVNNVNCGDKIPLKSYANPSAFKLYFVDIGLFRYLADIPIEVINSKTAIFDEFNGLVAEQFPVFRTFFATPT